MAISVDWGTKTISVPQADCILVSGTLYRLPTKSVFRAQVIALSAGEDGVPFQPPIDHLAPYTVFGITYFPKVEIINGYQVQFTPDAQWSVLLEESNNNIADIGAGILVQNQVQVIPNNSAGAQIIRETGVPERAVAWPNFAFNLVLSSDHASPATGKAGTITVRVCKDDGAWAVIPRTITEVGQGQYRIDLTAADMDFQTGTLMFSEPDVDPIKITIRTAGA